MRKLWAAAGIVGLMIAGATPAGAQARFGATISWADDADFGLGARLNFGLGSVSARSPIEGMVAFDYFFPESFDYWELTGNGIYRFSTNSSAKPYAGAGIGIGRASSGSPGVGSSTDAFLNLLAGLRFQAARRVLPFVEARIEFGDGSMFVLGGGIYFGKP